MDNYVKNYLVSIFSLYLVFQSQLYYIHWF